VEELCRIRELRVDPWFAERRYSTSMLVISMAFVVA
jgi:hypothetical protein